VLLLALLGGLALNLTPCVLPLIPINLAILGAGRRASSRHRGLMIGAAYGGAMAAVYGVLGAAVVVTSSAFGAINASPWFNVGVALVFTVLGLSMFDLFFIDASRLSARLSLTGARGSLGLAMTMGALAAVLAGACVAPVVIQVVVFSTDLYASGIHAAVALPFMLGLGMAAPWPIVGAGLAALPKPGAWMIRVKQALGVAILVLAVYYAHTAYGMFAARITAHGVPAKVATHEGWHISLADGLDVAAREHKPVFVDLWATWCKNCLAMDETTLVDPSVSSALAGYVKVKFQAEDPDDPLVQVVMKRFGAVGLPAYVVLRASDPISSATSAGAAGPVAPDFSLPALNGNALTLQSLRGRIVVLNFWATWCPPCRTEIPELMAVRKMFDADDVVLVGIATDEGGRAVVAPYVKRERFPLGSVDAAMNYPVLLGTPEVADAYRVDGLPLTVLLDRSGQEVRRFEQPVRADDLAPAIRRLISTSVGGVR
jgi:thiol:disulfide interchange protein